MKSLIEMAREAGIEPVIDPIEGVFFDCYQEELERFAELVRADEREACAALADKLEWSDNKGVASAIRVRGQA